MTEPSKAGNVKPWLARKHHPGLHNGLLSRVEPGRFMAIDPNTMADVMTKSSGETGPLNYLPRGSVSLEARAPALNDSNAAS